MPSLRVMLIEDDDLTRSTVKAALVKKGIDIVFDTPHVTDALTFAKKHRPNVAVVDYNLGKGPNGIDLANGLRKFDPSIGIVLLTAFLNPTQLPTQIAKLPKGSKYLIKHSVSEISVLIKEIEAAAAYMA